MTRVKLYSILMLVAVFLSGGLSGGGLVYVLVGRQVRGALNGPPEEAETRALMFALNRSLHLNETQRMQVRGILQRHRPEMNEARRSIEPRLKDIRAKIKEEILIVLSPSQQKRFDRVFDDWESRRHRAIGAP